MAKLYIKLSGHPGGQVNRSVDALQILQELIQIAKDFQKEPTDNLSREERVFYDELAQNSSAIEVMSNCHIPEVDMVVS